MPRAAAGGSGRGGHGLQHSVGGGGAQVLAKQRRCRARRCSCRCAGRRVVHGGGGPTSGARAGRELRVRRREEAGDGFPFTRAAGASLSPTPVYSLGSRSARRPFWREPDGGGFPRSLGSSAINNINTFLVSRNPKTNFASKIKIRL